MFFFLEDVVMLHRLHLYLLISDQSMNYVLGLNVLGQAVIPGMNGVQMSQVWMHVFGNLVMFVV